MELIFGFFTVRTSTCGEIWAPEVGISGKSRNFLGAGRNPQEMPIEAEGREDIDISSTRRWPEASADDGKRALAQLEVDVSPLRANKGGV